MGSHKQGQGLSRRAFGAASIGAVLGAALDVRLAARQAPAGSVVRGVRLGAITGVYGPFTPGPGEDVVDAVIASSLAAGIGHVEFVNSLLEPRVTGGGIGGQVPATMTPEYRETREALRQWRLAAPLDRFREIRRKFDRAGLVLFSYVMTIGDDFTDTEIDAVFRHMQALGVDKFCTNQTRVGMGPRMAPVAERYGIRPAFHNHALVNDPNEVASPESYARLFAMSKLFMANLDMGHYARGGNDPLAFLKANPSRITHVHVRDMKRDGSAADIGSGDLPLREMLTFVRDGRHPVAFILEQGRSGEGTNIEKARANLEVLRKVLESA
jgi:sugar phosphate isomerase/epimerase